MNTDIFKIIAVGISLLLAPCLYSVTLDKPAAGKYWAGTGEGREMVNTALDALNAGKVEWRGSVTTAERDALAGVATGDFCYNETASAFEAYDGSAWGAFGSGGSMTGSELETVLDAYYGDTDWRTQDGYAANTDDQAAAEVPFTPNGSIAATDVQAAIQEVRDEAGAGGGVWGSITGTLSAQSDLQVALDDKQAALDLVTQAEAETGTDSVAKSWSAERDKQAFDSFAGGLSFDIEVNLGLATNGSYSGSVYTGIDCGETLAVGDWVYYSAADGEWRKADNDGDANDSARGVIVLGGADGDPAKVLYEGSYRIDAHGFTAEAPLWLATTAGSATSTKPTTSGYTELQLGWALDANVVVVRLGEERTLN